jgi:hypothetical protein
MRKLLVVSLLVFAVALIMGSITATPAQALICRYTCSCDNTPLKCCLNGNGSENCKVTKNWSCSGPVAC